MPTASQAMIVMTDEGEDPRIPRRHYSTAAANISVASYDMDTAVKYSHSGYVNGRENIPNLFCDPGSRQSKLPNELKVKGYKGNMKYDSSPGSVRWDVAGKDKYMSSERKPMLGNRENGDGENIKWIPQRQTVDLGRKQKDSLPQLKMQKQGYQNNRDGLQGQRYTRRNLVPAKNTVATDRRQLGPQPILPRDAKFVPAPPGQTPQTVQAFLASKEIDSSKSAGDMLPIRPEKRYEPKLSLLDEVKMSVNFDNRVQPAMCMRKKLPPSNPFAICFSLRENDRYTHKEIKDIVEYQTGLKVRAVQYDPVSIRSNDADAGSRWIITFSTPTECDHAVTKGLEIGGDKIAIKLLNDVMLCEHEAYKIHLKDEKRKAMNERSRISRQPNRIPKKARKILK